jgi:ABC-type antimicrobial peptide transport system permease subunit
LGYSCAAASATSAFQGLREGLFLGALDLASGVAATVLLADVTEPLLYEIDPRSFSFVAVPAAVMLVVITVASMLPARRAAAVDPIEVLRAE